MPDLRSETAGISHLWERQIPAVERAASQDQRRSALERLKTNGLREPRPLARRLQIGIRVSKQGALEWLKQKLNRTVDMPVISKFYGIVIRMFFIRPFAAHFHAFYGDNELVVGINPLKIIQGDAPGRACAMVLEWARAHQSELLEDWLRCSAAQPPAPIAPLP